MLARQQGAGEAYLVHSEQRGLRGNNPAQGFGVGFDRDGVELVPTSKDGSVRLHVAGVGCEGAVTTLQAQDPQGDEIQPNMVWQAHEGLWAWYLNGPLGLQQGFEVTARPPCVDAAWLRVRIEVEGLRPTAAGAGEVVLRDGAGRRAMQVDRLYAIDADGKALAAVLGAEDDAVTVDVDARHARFPIYIDPMWSQETRWSIEGNATNDRLGSAVSLSGDTAVVGAPLHNEAGFRSGAAFVFVRTGGAWSEQQKLLASDAAERDFFGDSVDIDGDTLVVGADQNDDAGPESGSAYVFVRNGTTWTEQQKLVASDAAAPDRFGKGVTVSGETIAVGARIAITGAGSTGAVYVFERNGVTWTETDKLVPNDAAAGDQIGNAVSLHADTMIIGAHLQHAPDSDSGAAYVYVRSNGAWSLEQKLTPNDPGASDWFGFALSVSGGTAIVGAHRNDDNGSSSGSAYVFTRSGSTWSQEQKLIASDAGSFDNFGYAVGVSGDTAVVGSTLDDGAGTNAGAAYVFVRGGTTWTEQQKLASGDAAAGDELGTAVAVAGDTIVAGASLDDTTAVNAGAAYVFERNGSTWAEQAELLDAAGGQGEDVNGDNFGRSTSVSLDTAVVGAPGDDDGGNAAGAVYVFERVGATWTAPLKLTASDATAGAQFGRSTSLSGDTILIGAPYDETAGVAVGAAYVLVRDGAAWTEQAKLVPADGIDFGEFGSAVSLSGETALVGAYYDDDGPGEGSGSAYVYVRDGTAWAPEQKLTAGDGAAFDYFGFSVSLAGDIALVGAYAHDSAVADAGAAYVYVRNGTTWTEEQKLTASDAQASDQFGYAVSTTETTAVVGAPDEDTAGNNAGAAYVYVRNGTTWTEEQKLTASDGSNGDGLGSAVSAWGDRALVGAPFVDGVAPDEGAAYVFQRSGTSWAEEDKLVASDGGNNDEYGSALSLAGGTALVGAPRADDGGSDSGLAYLSTVDNLGVACVDDVECGTRHCVDGVCCDAACGDGATDDCQSCLGAETGATDGTCGVVTAGLTCRDAAGACDVAEACDGSATACPDDAVVEAGTTCRPAAELCDAEEVCDGTAATCPEDEAAVDGTPCDDGDRCTVADACEAGMCSAGEDTCGSGGGGGGSSNGAGGAGTALPTTPESDGGCSCRAAGRSSRHGSPDALAMLLMLGLARVRRRAR